MKKITILIPCYNEEQNLKELYRRVSGIAGKMQQYQWQLLFVDDGSTDATTDIVSQLRKQDSRVLFIELSRNFGKESAMMAGLDHAQGDAVIIIDADLQDPPELIPLMVQYWEAGAEDVYTRHMGSRSGSRMRQLLSQCYHILFWLVTGNKMLYNVGDFRLLDKQCVEALRQIRENRRYTKYLFYWIGFKKQEIKYRREHRHAGRSSFSYARLFKLGTHGLTSCSTAPLRGAAVVGAVVMLGTVARLFHLALSMPSSGYTCITSDTLIIPCILMTGGLVLLFMGIAGEYLGQVFMESKRRPLYIIRNKQLT